MTRDEYERRQGEIEARYRAALEILEAGRRAQMEELERLRPPERNGEPAPPRREAPPSNVTAAKPPEPGLAARPRTGDLLAEIRSALDRLPEEFTKNDLLRVLGDSPHRTTLFRALQQLELEGRIAVQSLGSGSKPAVYRKKPPRNGAATPP
jgi:hypothetical protein